MSSISARGFYYYSTTGDRYLSTPARIGAAVGGAVTFLIIIALWHCLIRPKMARRWAKKANKKSKNEALESSREHDEEAAWNPDTSSSDGDQPFESRKELTMEEMEMQQEMEKEPLPRYAAVEAQNESYAAPDHYYEQYEPREGLMREHS